MRFSGNESISLSNHLTAMMTIYHGYNIAMTKSGMNGLFRP